MTTDAVLQQLIVDLRDDLESEVPTRLHRQQPDTDRDSETYGHITGLPFTGAFLRYLGHWENYGYQFVAAASLARIDDECRKSHPEHFTDSQFHGTCWRLAVAVVELRQPLRFAALMEGLDEFHARRLLKRALEDAADYRGVKRRRASELDATDRAMDVDTAIPAILQREHDPRERQIWERIRGRYGLPPWEIELSKRRAWHARQGCEGCPLQSEAA